MLPGLGRPMLPRPWGTVEAPPAAASGAAGFCWLAAAASAARCAMLRPMLRPAVLLVRPPAQHPSVVSGHALIIKPFWDLSTTPTPEPSLASSLFVKPRRLCNVGSRTTQIEGRYQCLLTLSGPAGKR